MYSAQEIVSHVEALSTLPTVYHRIREQLDSDDGSLIEVARLVSADPALAAGVLRLVNSAFFGFGGKIDSVERAVPILGLQQVHDLVLAMSVKAVFDGIRPEHMDMSRFWHGSMMCALAARSLARVAGHPGVERMFVIGLLADVGHLVMYQVVPEQASAAQLAADAGAESLPAAECRLIGCNHAEIGAALMEGWKLPSCFADVIGAQLMPRLAGERTSDASVLHIARAISHADRYGESSEVAAARIEPVVWLDAELDSAGFIAARDEAELNLASCIASFFPRKHPR
ncbi:HDOD domain-containing protein [Azoarcus sp. L1K30]|uniref:HDOD domain-containing protein n=1 Tax=Azoarcus sp. L1K30 TaxID=2820277 RepID=UPI001B835C4D|nr:HDOD domain-containing protein [Azoarcus sp. L1K30]MBR0564975.1 HDOD domain-containing protein [Azoarcus sp. L1K30]